MPLRIGEKIQAVLRKGRIVGQTQPETEDSERVESAVEFAPKEEKAHSSNRVSGVRAGVAAANIRHSDRDDLVVFSLHEGTTVAAVFTRNSASAAPVKVAQSHLKKGEVRALVINSGNANAGVGKQGREDCLEICKVLAKHLEIPTESVLPFSTGVIGQRLPVDAICSHLPQAASSLDESNWDKAATAIMTTDTVPKIVSRKLNLSSSPVTITGIAKGSGMIRPDMATMLAFVATDAKLDSSLAQRTLRRCVNESFNRITVDGDTSTNDSCVLMATGTSGYQHKDETGDEDVNAFNDMLSEVFAELAELIIRDAEGATKFVSVEVINGWSEADCLKVAYTIAHSPLVKTAIFASDPNWGRIYAAVGRSMIQGLDMTLVDISINDVLIVQSGSLHQGYSEEMGVAAMKPGDIKIQINLHMGDRKATVLTTDLSQEYVKINAEYRS